MLADSKLLIQCCQEVKDLPGEAAEIGVWQGGSAMVILKHLDCKLHLFDTFTGMPKSMITPIDVHPEKYFNDTSLNRVALAVGPRCHIHAGIFPGTASEVNVPLKFVHIDCDLYLSTKAALEWCWPLLVPGGVILDDDYDGVPGAKKAVNEFLESHEVTCEKVRGRAIIRGALCASENR